MIFSIQNGDTNTPLPREIRDVNFRIKALSTIRDISYIKHQLTLLVKQQDRYYQQRVNYKYHGNEWRYRSCDYALVQVKDDLSRLLHQSVFIVMVRDYVVSEGRSCFSDWRMLKKEKFRLLHQIPVRRTTIHRLLWSNGVRFVNEYDKPNVSAKPIYQDVDVEGFFF